MTAVTYRGKNGDHSLEISGHANYAEHGKDIVCAAATTLFYTLLYALEGEDDIDMDYSVTPGAARVTARGTSQKGAAMCDTLFGAMAGGYEMLAAKYPEHVKIT